ncbi:hypothetical protein HAX54_033172 [Datura stramonium]|uniref:Uncharacterized protein n=1 Tax=Datura stramonium TaxID=4076 RepID=A0ABS8SDA1_DATST|nr:hypothetical protein [Datura stramonium]
MSPFERLIRNPHGSSYVESLCLMDEVWRMEERKETLLMVVMKQVELLEKLDKLSRQESEKSSSSRIKRMLEVMLELVVSTESRILILGIIACPSDTL